MIRKQLGPGVALPLFGALVFAAGCGPRLHPVSGTVALDDGTPLTNGVVVFESAAGASMARGPIGPDGSYRLSTGKPDDGVKPGRYRVLVAGQDLSDVPDEEKGLPFDVKYTRFQTSGLEVEVQAAPNVIPLRLDRPAAPPDEKAPDR